MKARGVVGLSCNSLALIRKRVKNYIPWKQRYLYPRQENFKNQSKIERHATNKNSYSKIVDVYGSSHKYYGAKHWWSAD